MLDQSGGGADAPKVSRRERTMHNPFSHNRESTQRADGREVQILEMLSMQQRAFNCCALGAKACPLCLIDLLPEEQDSLVVLLVP